VFDNDTGPLSNTGPLIDVVPDRTALVESALLESSSTEFSTELILDMMLYTEI
jgi:hypothetical protein